MCKGSADKITARSSAGSKSTPGISTKVDIAISTVDRPKNYIYRLLLSLRRNLRVRLIVGAPYYEYLKRYRNSKFVEIIGVTPTEWDQFKNYDVPHRASWNYWRCFVYGPRTGTRKGLLILEDDVLPAKGWEQGFSDAIKEIEAQYGNEYVLSLYTAFTELTNLNGINRHFRPYSAKAFRNTQAMYFPEPIRIAFGEYLRSEGVNTFRKHYDHLLSEYLLRTGIPLFVTTPCLFQHIGEVTTGLSFVFHSAVDF